MVNNLPGRLVDPAEGAENAESAASWPAPPPAPIDGAAFDQEDTWMTFGLGAEGEEENRTVTVVFRQFPEDETRKDDDFFAAPLAPMFPLPDSGRRR